MRVCTFPLRAVSSDSRQSGAGRGAVRRNAPSLLGVPPEIWVPSVRTPSASLSPFRGRPSASPFTEIRRIFRALWNRPGIRQHTQRGWGLSGTVQNLLIILRARTLQKFLGGAGPAAEQGRPSFREGDLSFFANGSRTHPDFCAAKLPAESYSRSALASIVEAQCTSL